MVSIGVGMNTGAGVGVGVGMNTGAGVGVGVGTGTGVYEQYALSILQAVAYASLALVGCPNSLNASPLRSAALASFGLSCRALS